MQHQRLKLWEIKIVTQEYKIFIINLFHNKEQIARIYDLD